MKKLHKILSTVALASVFTLGGCAVALEDERTEGQLPPNGEEQVLPGQSAGDASQDNSNGLSGEREEESAVGVQPAVKTVTYVKVTGEGVNIRKGAGTSHASLGAAQKDTLYACSGETGSWYKTYYKNSVAYINKKYCVEVRMDQSDAEIEKIIKEGCKCLGVKYVYGATRYHNGSGKLLSGFTTSRFDCSSLMQYIFKKGADINLQVNTRTQIYQGETVLKSDLKRGDLIFFTNASRKDNVGIERVGHVALYLGDNYILHTASDFAKIEQMSATRHSYYIQAQRML